ncbi:hypothetical protein H5187_18615 [Pseudoalteromonas sp. SG44-1]|uniref:hypothetical protein n=1 Tax=unclassified Pseudoalteromonas TaxID=194690 RepID=UPI001603B1D0|nr:MULTISPECIES: hypothetical protein [unclassified Pseudoalteromonas]MBB1419264.1 hypothetical protein [Pseudoalteromonas sp. SG44-1]MBB1435622.1 hypothetical protein [Pseudoalteromonas sp. SG43-6]
MKLTSNMFYHTIFMTALLLLSHTAIAGEHAKEMDAFIEQFHGFKQFNGNVLVAKQGKVRLFLKKVMATPILNGTSKILPRLNFE